MWHCILLIQRSEDRTKEYLIQDERFDYQFIIVGICVFLIFTKKKMKKKNKNWFLPRRQKLLKPSSQNDNSIAHSKIKTTRQCREFYQASQNLQIYYFIYLFNQNFNPLYSKTV